ncbi:DUF916 domain-containing protein [Brochothrix campestris]|uniref:Uncharacterized protein n=1 Tax=Brochothrix campestris FSL F6-1037 TaxID=1265861 RepID=W7CW30_9LIST|nr:DUF916 domain-containing protein [Brochothrix campestris]EUJ41142.1 hypothetical protein BCAMP_03980 [Brochothrix campestris FSL F6-1037]
MRAEQVGEYAVSPLLPAYQTEGVEHFFDIRWTPKQTAEFGVRITNKTNVKTTYTLQLNKARTNRNGVIDYADSRPEAAQTRYKLTDLIKLPETVVVEGKSSVAVMGKISFGAADFNGILMGGIHVAKQAETRSEGISHSVSYNLPLIIRGNDDHRPVPQLAVTDVTVTPLKNNRGSVDLTLVNQDANFLKEVTFAAVIKNKQGDRMDSQTSQWDLTPETAMQYPIKLNGRYRPGRYQVDLTVTHRTKGEWQFNETFELTAAAANQLNQKTTGSANSWISVMLAGVILLAYFISKYVRRQYDKQGRRNDTNINP